jgi:hypothetical protein
VTAGFAADGCAGRAALAEDFTPGDAILAPGRAGIASNVGVVHVRRRDAGLA